MLKSWKSRAAVFAVAGTMAVSVCGLASPAGADGATHFSFVGGLGVTSPCNGESFSGPVSFDGTYLEQANHVVVHMVISGTFVGSQGNTYNVKIVTNGQFDSPSGVYTLPAHGEFVSKGSAPNFSADTVSNVFAAGGVVVGANNTITGATCHG